MSTSASPSTQHGTGPAATRRPGPVLVVSDVDSTFIRDEVIELFARHAGVEEQVAKVTAAAMRGELDFTQSLHARVKALAGLPVEVIHDVRREVRLTEGAAEFVAGLAAGGHTLALVSGGFEEVVTPLAARMGIGHVVANRFEVADGRFTGRVAGRVVDRRVKAATLVELAQRLGIPVENTVAVGDGANDLDMLSVAGTGIAFCAKPVLREAADIVIDRPDLRLVLDALAIDRP
ncbi:phosphoserine phosphatase [Kineosphaera limosa]|uniref:phosphoserine phosphatase SerB n=1 Tax=Kineosphaera limosa TaxID=111564 RepID=UPI00180708E9|nr:phosphoserine phosphatase SerB [Kineosphaera limosa]NYE03162.1 phosphoserine phosphatase [Kineosphaera limosa]